MPKNKFYVVWAGKKPGIYSSWAECKAQVDGVDKAKYKGFFTRELAEAAWGDDFSKYMNRKDPSGLPKISCTDPSVGMPVMDSLSVDAACKGNPGPLEYRGVDTKSGAVFFKQGPFPNGTVNIGEFLAIVHALALLKKAGSDWPIYSDSLTAIAWVKAKKIRTNLVRGQKNEELFRLVDRALEWLKNNTYSNPIQKWETSSWGEIPADYGRK